jgi:hypothetical protein
MSAGARSDLSDGTKVTRIAPDWPMLSLMLRAKSNYPAFCKLRTMQESLRLGRMTGKGSNSPFWDEDGKVCHRRNLVVPARSGEGRVTAPLRTSMIRALQPALRQAA